MTHKSASSARNDIGGASYWPINKESPKSETDCIKKKAHSLARKPDCALFTENMDNASNSEQNEALDWNTVYGR